MKTLKLLGVSALSLSLLAGCTIGGDPDEEETAEHNVDTEDLPEMENPPNPDVIALTSPQEDLGRYSADELTGARITASEYITASLTTPTLLSGEWWEEGHKMKELTELGNFSEALEKDISRINPEDGVGAQATQSIALFLTETDTITATEECKTEGECSGEPFYGEPTWKSVNKNVVSVSVSASVVRPVLKEGEKTNSLDTYNYVIHMSEDDGDWTINQLQNSYTIGKETD